MNNYYIKAVLLENCSYSKKASNLLKEHNIEHIQVDVDTNTKDNYKTPLINTFPQIYLCKHNTLGTQLLGGYNDLASFIKNFKKSELDSNKIREFMKQYNWSRRGTLRLIQIINNIS
jgi:glutaredoxin